MNDDTPKPSPLRNGFVILAQEKSEIDEQLSSHARVLVGADRIQGKIPRYRNGITLQDAVIFSDSLPNRATPASRIRKPMTASPTRHR